MKELKDKYYVSLVDNIIWFGNISEKVADYPYENEYYKEFNSKAECYEYFEELNLLLQHEKDFSFDDVIRTRYEHL